MLDEFIKMNARQRVAAARTLKTLTILPIVAVAVGLTGCVSSRMPASASSSDAIVVPRGELEPVLRQEVDRWRGTPHVLGGSTAAGMDCSAFVQRVFADAFHVDLPRTTDDQVREGRRVNMSELRTGDLVFFQPPTKTNHVGIYLSDGEFAHVSSEAGVTVSELGLPYWRTAYWTSRRVLPDRVAVPPRVAETDGPAISETPRENLPDRERSTSQPASRMADQDADRSSPPPRRVGW